MICNTLRRANHTFMNDLQVVAGWLQMGDIQRALDYIDETKERVMRESATMNRLGPDHYGLFLAIRMKAESVGITLAMRDAGPDWPAGRPVTEQLAQALWEAVQSAAGKGIRSLELIAQTSPNRDFPRVRETSSTSTRDFTVRLEAGRSPAIIVEPPGE